MPRCAGQNLGFRMLVGNGLDFNDGIRDVIIESHLNGYVFRHQNVVSCWRLIGPYIFLRLFQPLGRF